MPIATVTSKGQVTVPKVIRDRLDIHEGDQLEFSIDDLGRIVVRSHRKAAGVIGILSDCSPNEKVTAEEMNRALRRRAALKTGRRSR